MLLALVLGAIAMPWVMLWSVAEELWRKRRDRKMKEFEGIGR